MIPTLKKPCDLVRYGDTTLCKHCSQMFDTGDEDDCPLKLEKLVWNWPMIAALAFTLFVWSFAVVLIVF